MASSTAAARLQKGGRIIQLPKPDSAVDRLLNRECEGDELIAAFKEDPVVSFGGFDIDFNDDIWDFTEITDANVSKCQLRISFAAAPMKDHLKIYVLSQTLWEEAKVQTLKTNVGYLEEWVRELGLEPGNIRLLGSSKVKDRTSTLRGRLSASYLGSKVSALISFLRFYEKLWGRLTDRGVIEFLEETTVTCSTIARETEGWPEIPREYLLPLMDTARSTMADTDAEDRNRITAATIVLLERLGLRISECLALEAGAIEVVSGPCGMPDIAQLSFRTWKGARGNGTCTTGKTVIDSLSLEAYLTLESLCETRRRELGVSTLIIYPNQRNTFCANSSFVRSFRFFLLKNRTAIPCINTQDLFPELQTMSLLNAESNYDKKTAERLQTKVGESGLNEEDVFVYPALHSFRVTFATRLYEGGYDFDVIAKLMNQVSPDMAASYVRSDKHIEREYSSAVYQAMLEDDACLLGSHADEFTEKVADYAAKLKGDVCGGINEIIDACAEHYPLRRKVGGVCIRCGNVVECPSNSPTDQVFCAFGICANQCHIYFMADVQLEIVREHMALVEENVRRRHSKAAVNELRKARNVLEGMLLPELAELDRQLELHGAEHVLKRHPQLRGIIEHRDNIDREVEKWKSMQL